MATAKTEAFDVVSRAQLSDVACPLRTIVIKNTTSRPRGEEGGQQVLFYRWKLVVVGSAHEDRNKADGWVGSLIAQGRSTHI